MESIDQGATRYVQDLSAMHVVRSFPVEPVLVASSPLRAMIPIELLPAVSRVQIITTTVSREHMKRETPRILLTSKVTDLSNPILYSWIQNVCPDVSISLVPYGPRDRLV